MPSWDPMDPVRVLWQKHWPGIQNATFMQEVLII